MLITLAVAALLVLLAIPLLMGRGAGMVAGYNTMSREKKEKYDAKAICRSVGKMLLGVSGCLLLTAGGEYIGVPWLIYTGVVLTCALPLGYVIYANTNNRFIKGLDE